MPDRVEVRGAGKPGVDFIEVPTFAESMIESLQQQRTRYEAEGDEDLMAKVDEQVAYYRSQLPTTSPGVAAAAEVARLAAEVQDAMREQRQAEQPEAPVSTEPGCTNEDCVLTHPHAGPAVLSAEAAQAAGMVFDRKGGGWRERRAPGRVAAPGEIVGE